MLEGLLHQMPPLLTLLGVVLVLFLLCLLSSTPGPGKEPPGPRPLPLLGNLLLLDLKRLQVSLCELSKKYGSVFTLHLGPKKVVVLAGYKTVKQALINYAEEFGDREISPITRDYMQGHGVLFANGKSWKEMRRFSLVNLRNFGMGKRGSEEKIIEESRYLIEVFENFKGEPFDTTQPVNYSISNIISAIVYGTRFDYADPALKKMVNRANEIIHLSVHTSQPAKYHAVVLVYREVGTGTCSSFHVYMAANNDSNIKDIINEVCIAKKRFVKMDKPSTCWLEEQKKYQLISEAEGEITPENLKFTQAILKMKSYFEVFFEQPPPFKLSLVEAESGQTVWSATLREGDFVDDTNEKKRKTTNQDPVPESSTEGPGPDRTGACPLLCFEKYQLDQNRGFKRVTPEISHGRLLALLNGEGTYECSVTSLVFEVTQKAEVRYTILSWSNYGAYMKDPWKIAGPIFDVDCDPSILTSIQLPHSLCLAGQDGEVSFGVLHVKNGQGLVEPSADHSVNHVTWRVTSLSVVGPVVCTPQPIEDTSQPVEDTSQPMEVTPQPMEVTPQPMEDTSQPVKKTPQPIEVTPQPVEVTPQPMEDTSQPVKKTPQPMEVTPQPVEVTPQPMEVTPQPMKKTPQPVKVTPQPVEHNSLVLVYRKVTTRESFTIHVYMVTNNISEIKDIQIEVHEKQFVKMAKSPKCKLVDQKEYQLISKPEGEITPEKLEFTSDVLPMKGFFEVFLEQPPPFKLSLVEAESRQNDVWSAIIREDDFANEEPRERTESQMRSCSTSHGTQHADVPADTQLLHWRKDFVHRVKEPVIKQLLDDLLADGVINHEEKDAVIEENRSTADKARKLFDIVHSKGSTVIEKLSNRLKERDPTLYDQLKLALPESPGTSGLH